MFSLLRVPYATRKVSMNRALFIPVSVFQIGVPLSVEDGKKPGIWIDAGIHAREWIAPATALYFIHRVGRRTQLLL